MTQWLCTKLKNIPMLLGVWVVVSVSYAASFECTQAISWVEQQICRDPALSQLDDVMTNTYRQVLQSTPVDKQPSLKQSQRDWLKKIRTGCKDVGCLTAQYNQRIAELSGNTFSLQSVTPTVDKEPDPKRFFFAFKHLVLANDKKAVAQLVRYPIHTHIGTIHNAQAFINQYPRIFTQQYLQALTCWTPQHVEEMGYRGYMVSNGALWLDKQYFGKIVFNKTSKKAAADVQAQLDDTLHWYTRVIAISAEAATCTP